MVRSFIVKKKSIRTNIVFTWQLNLGTTKKHRQDTYPLKRGYYFIVIVSIVNKYVCIMNLRKVSMYNKWQFSIVSIVNK